MHCSAADAEFAEEAKRNALKEKEALEVRRARVLTFLRGPLCAPLDSTPFRSLHSAPLPPPHLRLHLRLPQARRAARVLPAEGESAALVDFLLETEVEDMEYEVTRCRPLLTPAFLAWLDATLTDEKAKVSGKRREDRINELTSLQVVLTDELAKVDKHHAALGVAAERFKGLLSAADKRTALLELVAANHVDRALLEVGVAWVRGGPPLSGSAAAGRSLARPGAVTPRRYPACLRRLSSPSLRLQIGPSQIMQLNIDQARKAGREDIAGFMEKLRAKAGEYATL